MVQEGGDFGDDLVHLVERQRLAPIVDLGWIREDLGPRIERFAVGSRQRQDVTAPQAGFVLGIIAIVLGVLGLVLVLAGVISTPTGSTSP